MLLVVRIGLWYLQVAMCERHLTVMEMTGLDLHWDGVHVLDQGQSKLGAVAAALRVLPTGYVMLNCTYEIDGGFIPTFHRDVTSSRYDLGLMYPVYTLLVYDFAGPALSVCLGSHLTVPYAINPAVLVHTTRPGMSVLMDSDVLHASAMPENHMSCSARRVTQFKLAHARDLRSLAHLDGAWGTTRGRSTKCSHSLDHLLRALSILFPTVSKLAFTHVAQSKKRTWMNNAMRAVFGREYYLESVDAIGEL